MFKNIHRKIKLIANIILWVNSVLSFLGGIAIYLIGVRTIVAAQQLASTINQTASADAVASSFVYLILAIIFMIVGIFWAWVISCLIYGFGELIETNSIIAKNTSKVKPKGSTTSNAVHQLKEYEFTGNDTIIATCPCCYTKFSTKHISEDGLYICPSCKEKLKPTL